MAKKEQMNKFQKFATIGVFIALIFIPSIAWIFCSGIIGDDNSENRRLAEAPAFDIVQIDKFPKQFDNYYNDHAPFRTIFRNVWTRMNYVLFSDSVNDKIIIGKRDGNNPRENWLFFNGESDFSPTKNVQGVSDYTREQIEKVTDTKKKNKNQMIKEGRKLYYFIIPNKENIYREFLPDDIKIFCNESRDERLIKELRHSNEDIIYPKSEILDAKQRGQLYSKQDTHWNDLGAFYGFKALMQKIEPDFKSYDYTVEISEPQSSDEDLARYLSMSDFFLDNIMEIKYLEDIPIKYGLSIKEERQIDVFESEKPLIPKTVLVVGDSYRAALIPYLRKVFSKVISVNRESHVRSVIDDYDPDIVIMEAVERLTLVNGEFSLL